MARRLAAPVAAMALTLACAANSTPFSRQSSVSEALSWLRHLTPGAEAHCRIGGELLVCRGYRNGGRGTRYIAAHHPISMRLLAIYEVRERPWGVRMVMVWERPEEPEDEKAAEVRTA